ncbi:MAG TPA: sulfatase-like hydrolase/transferase [Planctomycetota bacterium]
MKLLLPLLLLAPQDVAPKPNVVIFLADDAGWGDYGHNGNTAVRTPHIDSLARDGARFDRFFVCTVCAPTRAELLTGRYHPRGGVRGVSTGQERLDVGEKTVADAFKAAGYATGAFGKWHNGSQWPYHPRARGFDEYYGHTAGHWGEYVDPPLEHDGRMVREKGYIVDLCVDKALAFIDRSKAGPFLCYVPFTTPHSPWRAPDEDWARWKDKPVEQRGAGKEDPNETRCALAMVENQDRNVGRVLAKLDDLRLRENTIVLYLSDNGPNAVRWNGGMKGKKGSLDEGGIRSPLLVRWPAKIRPGTEVREIAGAIDLLPTLTALAGIPRVGDRPLDGLDLSPLLLGRATEWPDRLLFSTYGGKVSARSRRHRLDPNGTLFDLVDDPGQTKAVDQPDVAARLAAAVAAFRKETTLPKDDRPFPVGYREFPITMLPARDGEGRGGVKRSSSAPNCSYFVNWKSTADAITWDVDVATDGEYQVSLDYTSADPGSTIELSLGTSKLSGKVTPAWDPPLYTNQDNVSRPHGESTMKDFRPLELGTIRLAKGRGLLTLRALEVPGASVMDLRRLTLTLK